MNILIINTYYYPQIMGGTEISVQKLAEGLSSHGHTVNVLCIGDENSTEIVNGVIVHRMKIKNLYAPNNSKETNKLKKVIHRSLEIYNTFNIADMENKIKSISPDIIHVNNVYGFSFSLWSVLKKCNIPIIHTLRDYYLACPKGNLLNRHGDVCKNPKAICKAYSIFSKKIFNIDHCITAPSNFTLNIFKENGLIKDTSTKLIYNAIDFNKEESIKIVEEKKKREDKNIRFVYLGTLYKQKGIKWLIESFRKIDSEFISLDIAGKGELEGFVKENCNSDNRINYHGFLKEEEMNKLLCKADVIIVPSIWYEPFGRVVIDAYKNGVPVIASDMGGLSEIVENESTGLLVKPNSEQELINAIIKFNDRKYIVDKLENCINILERFSIETQIESFEELYKSYLTT